MPGSKYYFLRGNGEMATLMQKKDWSSSALGTPDEWPQTLKTSLALILSTRFPKFIFWGRNLICFYNDAYRPSLGSSGKHPDLIGKPAKEGWPEIYDFITNLTEPIFNGGEALLFENQLVPIERNGKMEDVYWTYCYSPIIDEEGNVAGVMVTAQETTETVVLLDKLEKSNSLFQNMIVQAPTAICVLEGTDYKLKISNDAYLSIIAKTREEAIGKPLFELLPEVKEQISPLLKEMIESKQPFYGNEYLVPLVREGKLTDAYFNFVYQPVFLEDGSFSAIMVVATEVTGHVEARNKLEAEKERLRLSTESTVTATWDINLDKDYFYHSPSLTSIFGYESKQLLSLEDIKSHVSEADRLAIASEVMKNFKLQRNLNFVIPITDAKGNNKWLRVSGNVILKDNGEPLRLLGVLSDVTETFAQKKLNEDIINKLNIALQASDLGIFELDLDTKKVEHSSRIAEMFGYSDDEKIGLDIVKNHLLPEFNDVRHEAFAKAIDTGLLHFDCKIKKKDNTYAWLQLYGKISYNNNTGKPEKIVGTIRDISESKSFQATIEESERNYRFLADFMPQFIWRADKSGSLFYWNKSVYEYTGLTYEQMMGEPGWLSVVHPDEAEKNVQVWLKSIETGQPFLFEHRFKGMNGEYRWQLSRAIPVKNKFGEIESWIGTSTDIEDIKKAEEQKNDFIKMANHELKTPVTIIKGYVQMLNKTHGNSDDPVLSTSLSTINSQVNKLNKLISDLLDITRMETGQMPLHKDNHPIGDIVKSGIDDMVAASESHKINYHDNGYGNVEVYIDKDRISQIISNLLTNAIKYSPGKDAVFVELTMDKQEIIVSVTDKGIGMDKEQIEHIFKRFYRVPGEAEKTFPGFGIGLYIVSELLERHKGNIWVESEKGKGSTFYFSLPIVQ